MQTSMSVVVISLYMYLFQFLRYVAIQTIVDEHWLKLMQSRYVIAFQ